ncbi:MAG: flagellar basal body P-ring formation chaperone FlgA [Bacillota bacterium]
MFNIKNVLLAIMIILIFSMPILSTEIYLFDEAEISSYKIILGEIAEINTDSNETYEKLSAIELGEAPRPGRSLEISPELVSLYIRNEGFARSDYNIISEDNIIIKVSSQELTVDKLLNKVEKLIKDEIHDNTELQALEEDFKIEIELLSGPGKKVIPAGDVSIVIAEDIEKPAGRLNIPVEIYVDNKYWDRVYMTLRINYQMNVYLLDKDLSRNQAIDDDDLVLKEKEIDFYPIELVLNLDTEIVQHGVSIRNYQKGEILRLAMLEYPDIISYNQEIIGEFEQGSVYVTTKVKARGNGSIGEIIEVENVDTGKIMKAKVLNENRVRIIN